MRTLNHRRRAPARVRKAWIGWTGPRRADAHLFSVATGNRLITMAPRSTMHAAKPTKSKMTQPSATSVKKKVLPKKETSLGDRVQRLFMSLCAQIDGCHFTNAIKTCDKGMCSFFIHDILDNVTKVLRLVLDDEDARQTKLFLLLQTERYSDALALLRTSDKSSGFEQAYSSYRLQRLDETAQLLDAIKQRPEQSRGSLHLEAQLVRTIWKWERYLSWSSGRTTDKAIIR